MTIIPLEKDREVKFYARINEDSVPVTFTFLNSDGTPYDISTKEWELPVYDRNGNEVFKLTEGDGLTVTGASDNKLEIFVDAATATQRIGTYFAKLRSVDEDHTWLNGDFIFHDGRFNGFDASQDITIYENGGDITITIEGEQSLSVSTVTSTATLTPTTFDAYEITAQAVGLTIANPSTDYSNFDGFIIRLEDNGTARALTWGNKYRAQGEALPSTTTLGKVMIITALRDSTNDKYDVRFSEEV